MIHTKESLQRMFTVQKEQGKLPYNSHEQSNLITTKEGFVITTYKLYFKVFQFLIIWKHNISCCAIWYNHIFSISTIERFSLHKQYLVLRKVGLLWEDLILYKHVCIYPYTTGRFVFIVSNTSNKDNNRSVTLSFWAHNLFVIQQINP